MSTRWSRLEWLRRLVAKFLAELAPRRLQPYIRRVQGRNKPAQPAHDRPPAVSQREADVNFARWSAAAAPWAPSDALARAARRERQHPGAGSAAGGQAVRQRYGDQFFSAIGARGGLTVAHERGTEYLQQLGAKGGAATRQRYGPEHYREIGRKGGQAGRGRKRRAEALDQPA